MHEDATVDLDSSHSPSTSHQDAAHSRYPSLTCSAACCRQCGQASRIRLPTLASEFRFSPSTSASLLRGLILAFNFHFTPLPSNSRLRLPLHTFNFKPSPSTSNPRLRLPTLEFPLPTVGLEHRLWVPTLDTHLRHPTLTSDIELSPPTPNTRHQVPTATSVCNFPMLATLNHQCNLPIARY